MANNINDYISSKIRYILSQNKPEKKIADRMGIPQYQLTRLKSRGTEYKISESLAFAKATNKKLVNLLPDNMRGYVENGVKAFQIGRSVPIEYLGSCFSRGSKRLPAINIPVEMLPGGADDPDVERYGYVVAMEDRTKHGICQGDLILVDKQAELVVGNYYVYQDKSRIFRVIVLGHDSRGKLSPLLLDKSFPEFEESNWSYPVGRVFQIIRRFDVGDK